MHQNGTDTVTERRELMRARRLRIFHVRQPTSGLLADLGLAPSPRWPEDFVLVAELEARGGTPQAWLEDAFVRTQHGDRSWRDQPDVMPTRAARRSTSVGDVMVLPDGSAWRCCGEGWAPVT